MKKSHITSPVFTFSNKLKRVVWNVSWNIFVRHSPIFLYKYRIFIYKMFGAEVSWESRIYPSAVVWLPQNLRMGKHSTLGPDVTIYNQGRIEIEDFVIVSQRAHLCASTHDYNDPLHPLVLKPITIHDHVWVCADAFVGPGVTLAEGTVVGARAAIFKDSEAWSVYSGNPAQLIKKREPFARG